MGGFGASGFPYKLFFSIGLGIKHGVMMDFAKEVLLVCFLLTFFSFVLYQTGHALILKNTFLLLYQIQFRGRKEYAN